MATERTYTGKVGGLRRLNSAMVANSDDLKDLEATRLKLEALMNQAEERVTKQGALRAEKQDTSKQLKSIFIESDRLANVLRLALKAHYGVRSEKLAEFGLQPFRGLKAKPAAETPEAPQPTPPAAEPTTTK
ncbi:MAG TPA: hypothetical protein VF173_35205 [Thermoanaerobaculia bacterium]|nr:hypothetical protein [Thermoanaerobaculia bacterium]